MGAVLYFGDRIRDPNLENYPCNLTAVENMVVPQQRIVLTQGRCRALSILAENTLPQSSRNVGKDVYPDIPNSKPRLATNLIVPPWQALCLSQAPAPHSLEEKLQAWYFGVRTSNSKLPCLLF